MVESTSWFTLIFLAFAVFGGLASKLLRFMVELGGVADAAMAIGLLSAISVVHVILEGW